MTDLCDLLTETASLRDELLDTARRLVDFADRLNAHTHQLDQAIADYREGRPGDRPP